MKNSSRIASLVVCVLVCQPSIVTGVRMEDEDSHLHLKAGACPTSVATKKTFADAESDVKDAKAAVAAADAAVGDAKADKTSADSAVGDAKAAKTSADKAVEDAKAALAAAEAAAGKAQSTLEIAESAAGTAQSTLASAESAAGTAQSTLASAESAAATAQAAHVAAAKLESDCNTCISDRSQYWESNECKTDDAYRTRFFVRVWTSDAWYAGTNLLPSVQLFEGDDHVSKKVQIGKANDDYDDFEAGSDKTYMVDLDHKMKPDKFCISFPGASDKWLPEKIKLYNHGPYDVYMKDWDWFTKAETQCKDITDIRMTDPDR